MKVFVSFGYNDRDSWIEKQVFPILGAMGFTVVHGKVIPAQQQLEAEIKRRIEQSDAAIGFLTIRKGQAGQFTSHMWVRDELMYAKDKGKLIIAVKEVGAEVPNGLFGNIHYIPLDQKARLACVTEVVKVLGGRNIRRLNLSPESDDLTRRIKQLKNREPNFLVRYRMLEGGLETEYQRGELEIIDQAFYLNVSGVRDKSLIEVQGVVNGAVQFSSHWVSADAVRVQIS
jgi:hypothetical protein